MAMTFTRLLEVLGDLQTQLEEGHKVMAEDVRVQYRVKGRAPTPPAVVPINKARISNSGGKWWLILESD